jgi:hypothetical protein
MPRPRVSPAFIVATIALVASVGGVGYAATNPPHHAAAAKKKSKALTKTQVNKLIASYFKKHRTQLTGKAGPQGLAGTPGPNGGRGPQGPGAIPLNVDMTSDQSTRTAATPGPWTFTLDCNVGNATLTMKGPGTFSGTEIVDNGSAQTFTAGSQSIGNGIIIVLPDGDRQSSDLFFHSGSTIYEIKFLLTALGGSPDHCSIIGDAIPVS